MKIIASSENLTMKESYNLTKSPEIQRMSDHVGDEITVVRYMVREEERPDTGELVSIASINDGETTYSTNSPTFVREFMGILEMARNAGEQVHKIRIAQGTSNKGRRYVTCIFVE